MGARPPHTTLTGKAYNSNENQPPPRRGPGLLCAISRTTAPTRHIRLPHNQSTTNSYRNSTDLDAECNRSRCGNGPISARNTTDLEKQNKLVLADTPHPRTEIGPRWSCWPFRERQPAVPRATGRRYLAMRSQRVSPITTRTPITIGRTITRPRLPVRALPGRRPTRVVGTPLVVPLARAEHAHHQCRDDRDHDRAENRRPEGAHMQAQGDPRLRPDTDQPVRDGARQH